MTTKTERRRQALERELRALRKEWKATMDAAWLPTGLQCFEACDHDHALCATRDYLLLHARPIEKRAETVKAQLDALAAVAFQQMELVP